MVYQHENTDEDHDTSLTRHDVVCSPLGLANKADEPEKALVA